MLPSRAAGRPASANDSWSLAGVVGVDRDADAEPCRRPRPAPPGSRSACRRRSATGTTAPTPTRSSDTIPRRWRRSARRHLGDVVERAEVVLEVAGPTRLLAAEGHEDHRVTPPGADDQRRAVSSSTAMPDALSSAPGATATVSRWAPTTTYGDRASKPRGRATTLTDVPASTGTPHELPAGTGKDCRDTSYPRSSNRRSTQRAARRKAGPVASRGPISPARNRTVRMARAVENDGTRGSAVGSTVARRSRWAWPTTAVRTSARVRTAAARHATRTRSCSR